MMAQNPWLIGQEPLGATVNGITSVKYPDGTEYKVTADNTHYPPDAPDYLIKHLEDIRHFNWRVRFHWGDTNTGRDWGDTYDVCGTIGRTTGRHAPILLHNSRSHGGHIVSMSIVKITHSTKPHHVIYEHPTYHISKEDN